MPAPQSQRTVSPSTSIRPARAGWAARTSTFRTAHLRTRPGETPVNLGGRSIPRRTSACRPSRGTATGCSSPAIAPASYRLHTHEDFGEFGWQAPSPLTTLNTPFGEAGPSYFQDDAGTAFLYFNSNKPGGLGSADIYVAVQQPEGSFGAVAIVTSLNSPF